MSSVAQDRNLGVILEFSISSPHHSQFTLALKCLKKKKKKSLPYILIATGQSSSVNWIIVDNLLTGLTISNLLFYSPDQKYFSEMQTDNFIPLLK